MNVEVRLAPWWFVDPGGSNNEQNVVEKIAARRFQPNRLRDDLFWLFVISSQPRPFTSLLCRKGDSRIAEAQPEDHRLLGHLMLKRRKSRKASV